MKTGDVSQLPTFFPYPQDDREDRSSEETTSGILPDLSVNVGDESFADRVWRAVEQAAAASAASRKRTQRAKAKQTAH
jgi:hypothetical protein